MAPTSSVKKVRRRKRSHGESSKKILDDVQPPLKPTEQLEEEEEWKGITEETPRESDDESIHLHGFSSDDDDDSSDDSDVADEPSGVDVTMLPTIAKDDAAVKRKLDKAKKNPVSSTSYSQLPAIYDFRKD
jgi:nucleolar protein 15